ncbi:hypothetical protein CEXT_252921 [Caerostris extrusa]|uniref:Uncharacterized protein n=1 Tax=Caerostris extrusa TaxID=172846 RepID=A0AAV4U6U8_CAEEX|nr:hypothetical protein CEXT_252921 [Caerostris extrusa]
MPRYLLPYPLLRGNDGIIKRRKEVYGGGDSLNDYTRDLGVLGCSANDLFSSDRGTELEKTEGDRSSEIRKTKRMLCYSGTNLLWFPPEWSTSFFIHAP